MSLRVVTAPEPFVTWAQAKAHLREDSDDEKAYVEILIAAASAWIDGPAGWLGRCLGPQLLEWRGEFSSDCPSLPMGAVLEIESIVTNPNDGPATVDPSLYDLLADGSLDIPDGADWVDEPEHLVRYWAGYGHRDPEDAEAWIADVPAPVCHAILLLVGQWFYTRSNVRLGDSVNEMPMAVEALLAPYRVFS